MPFRGACALLCTHEDDHTSVRMYSVWLCAWDDVCPQITETIVDEEHRGADQCVAEWTTLDKSGLHMYRGGQCFSWRTAWGNGSPRKKFRNGQLGGPRSAMRRL